MTTNLETLAPVLSLAHGQTAGGEPSFTFPDVLQAISLCTANRIAILGVELFEAQSDGYNTEAMSAYEVRLAGQSWQDFVNLNNHLADEFIRHNPRGDGHFYLLTASQESEFSNLAND
jgi:hypothetical protein